MFVDGPIVRKLRVWEKTGQQSLILAEEFQEAFSALAASFESDGLLPKKGFKARIL